MECPYLVSRYLFLKRDVCYIGSCTSKESVLDQEFNYFMLRPYGSAGTKERKRRDDDSDSSLGSCHFRRHCRFRSRCGHFGRVCILLIGFSGKKGRRPNFLTSDGLKAIGTLLVVAVFMVLAYSCTLTSGSLIRFNGMDPVFQYEQGKKLLFIGLASAAWFVASFLWLLPYIVEIKPRDWNRNHLIGVGVYFTLVFAAAGAAML